MRRWRMGVSLVEIIIGLSVFVTVIVSFFGAASISLRASAHGGNRIEAVFLAEEGVEGVRFLRDISWKDIIEQQTIFYDQCLWFDTTNPLATSFATGQKGAVLWFHLDESGGSLQDNSGGNHDGDAVGALHNVSGGKYGGYVSGDGASPRYVNVPYNSPASYLNMSSFSVSAWIRTGDVTGGVRSVVAHKAAASGWEFNLNNNVLEFRSTIDSGTPLSGGGQLNTDTWRHVAVVRSISGGSSLQRLFVDGVKVAERTTATPAAYSLAGTPLTVASRGGAQLFNGGVDEVVVYNRGLSDEEVYFLARDNTPACGSDLGQFVRTVRFKNVCREDDSPSGGYDTHDILGPTEAQVNYPCTGPNGTAGRSDEKTRHATVRVRWGAQHEYEEAVDFYFADLFNEPRLSTE